MKEEIKREVVGMEKHLGGISEVSPEERGVADWVEKYPRCGAKNCSKCSWRSSSSSDIVERESESESSESESSVRYNICP